jgi:hypothetical protein
MREYQIPFYERSLRLHSFHFAVAVERALTKSKPLRVRQLEIAPRQEIRQSWPRSPKAECSRNISTAAPPSANVL